MIHVYTAKPEPATRYDVGAPAGYKLVIRNKARALVWCRCCKRRRWAGYCVVRVYYDAVDFYCAAGRGCKEGEAMTVQRKDWRAAPLDQRCKATVVLRDKSKAQCMRRRSPPSFYCWQHAAQLQHPPCCSHEHCQGVKP